MCAALTVLHTHLHTLSFIGVQENAIHLPRHAPSTLDGYRHRRLWHFVTPLIQQQEFVDAYAQELVDHES